MSKGKEKICPMPLMHECIKKKCAWWDDITGFCAVVVIARFGAEGAFHVGRREQKADTEEIFKEAEKEAKRRGYE